MSSDEDRSGRGGSARYGPDGPGTGANEPKHREKKEQRADWVPRQGGDQSRDEDRNSARVGDTSAEEGR
jgi:hypothetical protein